MSTSLASASGARAASNIRRVADLKGGVPLQRSVSQTHLVVPVVWELQPTGSLLLVTPQEYDMTLPVMTEKSILC